MAAQYLVRKVAITDLDQLEAKLNKLATDHDGYRLKEQFYFPPGGPTHLFIVLENNSSLTSTS